MIYRWKSRNGLTVIDISMNKNRLLTRIIILIMTLAGILVILYFLWSNGAFLPKWIAWTDQTFYDQSGKYEILLGNKSLCILAGDDVIWTSPEEVKIQEALSCDIDNDGEDELLLLCWKRGRYGTHRPFWVDRDESKWSQHIFVYEYNGGEVRPKWMSSYIGQDVSDIGENQKEGRQVRLLLTDPDGKVSSWMWNSWGFAKEDTDVSFVVFGDNLIHEPIYRYGLGHEASFEFLFENFKDIISASDVAVINQETPFTEDPSKYSDYPRFGTPVFVGEAIVNAGFTVVTCATNHALDRGIEGINTTKRFFDAHNVKCLGIQAENEKDYCPYQILEKNGICIAMLNYTYGTNGISIPDENPYMVHLLDDEDKVRDDIGKARSEADFVIVFAHWGTEYSKQTDSFQQRWTQIFLESKADVVIGTHPHVLQPYEMLEDEDGHKTLVFYSIGNYISAQSEKTCVKGGMASFTVSLTSNGYEITEYTLQPLSITWQEGRYMVDVADSKP